MHKLKRAIKEIYDASFYWRKQRAPIKYRKLWNEIRDLIRSNTNTSDSYDKKYLKRKFNSNDDLPLKKTLELHNMIIVVISAFDEDNKYYPKSFLDEWL